MVLTGALLLSMSGCGLAALTGAAVASGSSSSSGGARANTAPSLVLETASLPSSVTGNLVLAFQVVDGEGDTVSLTTRISADNGGSFRSVPSSAVLSGSTEGLGGSADGVRFSFTINLADPALFPGQTINQAVIELTPTDSFGLAGPAVLTPAFSILNNSPPTLTLQNNVDDALEVTLNFRVADANAIDGPGQREFALTDGTPGVKMVTDFNDLINALPVLPGTLLIRYGNSNVLRDVDNGDGTGRLVALNGPEPSGSSATINYSTGQFGGDGSITVTDTMTVTADYNQSYLTVTGVEYDNLRDSDGVQPCTPILSNQRTPFPVFVTQAGIDQTFIWDSLRDLDFGNSKFVRLQVRVSDGQDETTVAANNFFIDNGPFGETTQRSTLGEANGMAIGDLNNDGVQDIVTSDSDGRSVSVFLGNGRAFNTPTSIPIPIPQRPGAPPTNLVDSPPLGNAPAGATLPFFLALLDVNQDGDLDLALGSNFGDGNNFQFPVSPNFYNHFFIYFGDGQGGFNTANGWGPFRTGGFGLQSLRAINVNPVTGFPGASNEDNTTDLVVVSRYSHDPLNTRSRVGLAQQEILQTAPEPFSDTDTPPDNAINAGNPYNLNGNFLNNAPVLPGSVVLIFDADASKAVVDQRISSSLGALVEIGTGQSICYIDYASGALVADPAPGAIPATTGMTSFNVNGFAGASYKQRIDPSQSINTATFMSTGLNAGDSLTIRGWGTRGLNIDGASGAISTLSNRPIDQTLILGTDLPAAPTFNDLMAALDTIYTAQLATPAREQVSVVLDDDGKISVRVEPVFAGEFPRHVTTMEVQISDSQGNTWPLFEDSFGRVAIYHVNPGGGFSTPNLSQEVMDAGGAQVFPPFFPPTRNDVPRLLPAAPTGDLAAGEAGPGTLEAIYALVDATGGQVQFPPTVSTAGAAGATLDGGQPLLSDPANDPPAIGRQTVDTAGQMTTFANGLLARDVDGGLMFSAIPAQASDPFVDLIVTCGGDVSLAAMVKAPGFVLLANPGLSQAQRDGLNLTFEVFDYLDGLFVTQGLGVGTLVNGTLAQSGLSTFFLQPGSGSDLNFITVGDLNGDNLDDIIGPAGNFLLTATNLSANPPPAPLPPFDVRLGVVGLQPGRAQLGDINSDGLTDILLPIGATEEFASLIQTPRVSNMVTAPNGLLDDLAGQLLSGIEIGRGGISPSSIEISFVSEGTPHVLRGSMQATPGSTVGDLLLFSDPGTVNEMQVGGVVGTISLLNGQVLTMTSSLAVDNNILTYGYDQQFSTGFIQNGNITNFKPVRFPAGFIPEDIAVFDINGDQLDDVVTLDTLNNSINFRFQIRESPFDNNFISIPTGLAPLFVLKGNFLRGNLDRNGVDKQEVFVTNAGSNTISLYEPDPIQGLVLIQEIQLTIPNPANPGEALSGAPVPLLPFGGESSDIDGDGADEILVGVSAIAGASGLTPLVPGMPEQFQAGFVVIPGLTVAQFNSGVRFGVSTIGLSFETVIDVTAIDMNGDGLLDIAAGSNIANFATFHFNQGGAHPVFPGPNFSNFGNFVQPPNPASALSPFLSVPKGDPVSGDMNRVFASRIESPVQLTRGDLNQDGFVDLIFGVGDPRDRGFPSVGVFVGQDVNLNNGNYFPIDTSPTAAVENQFMPQYIDISAITNAASVAVFPADLNMDTKPDLVIGDLTADARAGFLINTTDTSTMPPGPIQFQGFQLPAIGQPSGVAVGDVNSDGLPDIVIALQAEAFIAVYLNKPSNPGTFELPIFQPSGPGPIFPVILDVNEDGKNDVIVSAKNSNTLSVFLQR